MNVLNKEPVTRVKKALKDFDSSLDIVELKTSARTAIDAANSLKCEIGAIVKSLLFKTEKNFILCLVAGDKKCSLKKLKKITNLNDIKNLIEDYIKDINTTRIVDSALSELIEKVIEENKFDFCLPFD